MAAYRQMFLEQMQKDEERLPKFESLDGNDEDFRVSRPVERLRFIDWMTHDQSILASYDSLKRQWLPTGE